MNTPRKILGISGSTKKESSSDRLLRILSEKYKDIIELEIFNRIEELPHFNPELSDNPPNEVRHFRSLIEEAEGIIICTPEYVFSLPGSLKNAIEWIVSTTLFSSKPVALIVAAASGDKAFESLSLIMETIESRVYEDSRLLIKGIKGKLGKSGELDKEVLVQ